MGKVSVLTKDLIPLTERELAVLAASVCEMAACSLNPYDEAFIIQVAPGRSFTRQLFIYKAFVSETCSSLPSTSMGSVLCDVSLCQDQSFGRQTWHRRDPRILPCLLPSGKYIVTKRWSLLTAKDWCLHAIIASQSCFKKQKIAFYIWV